MKKNFISFIILLLIFSAIMLIFQNFSYASATDGNSFNKRNQKAAELAIEQLLEPYKLDSVPEEERIVDYKLNGYGVSNTAEEGNFSLNIGFDVTPFLEEHSIWNNYNNSCFAEFSMVDEDIEVVYISRFPKNYDKFLERFKEYQENTPKKVEVEKVQGSKRDDIKTSQVEKISNIIFIFCGIILAIIVINILFKLVKKNK